MKTLVHLLTVFLLLLPLHAQRPQGLGENLRAVVEANGTLLAIRDAGAAHEIVRSTDGGQTFDEVLHSETFDDLLVLDALGGIGLAGGSGGLLLRADLNTAPATWTEVDWSAQPVNAPWNVVALAHDGDQTRVVAGDDGSLLLSGDQGVTWSDFSPPGALTLAGVAWNAQQETWVAVGDDTVYMHDGSVWSSQTLAGNMFTAVASDAFGNVLVGGVAGAVVHWTPGGGTFEAVSLPGGSSEGFTTVIAIGENDFLIGGEQRGIWQVTDGVGSEFLSTSEGETEVHQIVLLDGAVGLAGVAVVAPPQISAPDSPSSDPVLVTLVPDEPSHKVYYTLEGSEPETGALYEDPFAVSGTRTVLAVSEENGVYSAVSSMEVEAGELSIFRVTSIALDGGNLVISQDMTDSGVTYRLESTQDLTADPQVWDEVATQVGGGAGLTWTVPLPDTRRYWRVMVP